MDRDQAKAFSDAVNSLTLLLREDAPPAVFQRLNIVIQAMIWSPESNKIVCDAADKLWRDVNLTAPPWE